MTNNETPRVRSLLRQADRNVKAGKFAAAEELYRQIVAESPESAAAWFGLSTVARTENDRQEAYARALELDPHIAEQAETKNDDDLVASDPGSGLDAADGPSASVGTEAVVASEFTAVSVEKDIAAAPAANEHAHQYEVVSTDVELFCYRHPNRSTSLRCYKCNKPICSECTVKTPVGYLCPDCYRDAEDAFFNAKPTDYFLAVLVALPLSLIAGFLVMQFSRGLLFIILTFFIGGAIGGVIGRVTKRVIGGRRGRYIPHLVAACVIIGVLVWALPILLINPSSIFTLIGPGIYLATAVGSAYYWAR